MDTYLTILTLTIASAILIIITKFKSNLHEKWLSRVSIYSSIMVIAIVMLLIFDLRIKGRFTSALIGLSFLISSIILFSITGNGLRKFLSGLIAVPIISLGLLSLIWKGLLIFLTLPYFIFQAPLFTTKIDHSAYKIEVRNGGFMSCGESIYVTETKYLFFDKQIYVGNNSCVKGIDKIETKSFSSEKFVFLIHHDGELNDENPYTYEIKR